MKKKNEPAFPIVQYSAMDGATLGNSDYGLTKREYFAAHADIPWEAVYNELHRRGNYRSTLADQILMRVGMRLAEADALLAELEKEKE